VLKYNYFCYNSKYSYKNIIFCVINILGFLNIFIFVINIIIFIIIQSINRKNIIICGINIIIFIIILLGALDAEPIGLKSCVMIQFCWVRCQDPFRMGPMSELKSLGS
jgi:hypothetical protein